MGMTWRAARALSRPQTAHPAGFFAARETVAGGVLVQPPHDRVDAVAAL